MLLRGSRNNCATVVSIFAGCQSGPEAYQIFVDTDQAGPPKENTPQLNNRAGCAYYTGRVGWLRDQKHFAYTCPVSLARDGSCILQRAKILLFWAS
jgi:hypothetical protein